MKVPWTQMLRILEMPLTQPYIEQGLGVQLEKDLVVLEDLEDPEEEEEEEEECLC